MSTSTAQSRFAMISNPADRIAVVGTGLIGTSVALAATRVGCSVTGWDANPETVARAADRGGFQAGASFEACLQGADVVVIATPIDTTPGLVTAALALAPDAIVTDVASVKSRVIAEVVSSTPAGDLARFVPGHPMGGSERSGPDHASASVVDGIVWVLTPTEATDPSLVGGLGRWIDRIGARVMSMPADRHDRLMAFVSHLPQIASTTLMSLAATEEADEPDILLLAAGGFRDLTRLAASNPSLWSEILLANREAIAEAIDLYAKGLDELRTAMLIGDESKVEATFDVAKRARLRLSTKPKVRAGVAVLQVVVPDQPGALAQLTAALGDADVNIEDLQIVHSPEGGRGTVHVTVAAGDAEAAARVLTAHDLDPTRLA
jgi:prephenate dehydrogenase